MDLIFRALVIRLVSMVNHRRIEETVAYDILTTVCNESLEQDEIDYEKFEKFVEEFKGYPYVVLAINESINAFDIKLSKEVDM